jgi:hypothetical protein
MEKYTQNKREIAVTRTTLFRKSEGNNMSIGELILYKGKRVLVRDEPLNRGQKEGIAIGVALSSLISPEYLHIEEVYERLRTSRR